MAHIPLHVQSPSRMKLNVVDLAQRSSDISFKQVVKEMFGNHEPLEGWKVPGRNVVVATYVRHGKTKGGILMPDKSVEEDRWQGKVGLVLRLGHAAFKYGEWNGRDYAYDGPKAKVWDYITFHTSDARESSYAGLSIKYIHDSLILGVIPEHDADRIY